MMRLQQMVGGIVLATILAATTGGAALARGTTASSVAQTVPGNAPAPATPPVVVTTSLGTTTPAAIPAPQPAPAPPCGFVLGFQTMYDRLSLKVGACLEPEQHNVVNGDAVQRTSGGLLVWRKADNWTAFTDGYQSWINGPNGLVKRLNTLRFPWEANPDGLPLVPPAPKANPTLLPNVQTLIPTRLSIPSIGVNAPVERIGLTADGELASPTEWMDVGWFQDGYVPGQAGNASIVGHLDSHTGPAVFWRVNQLRPGARVIVSDGSRSLTFIVQATEKYPTNNSPMWRIYGESAVPHLNLVTCAGDWDAASQRYDQRTVVYTVLEGFQEAAAPTSKYFPEAGGYVVSDDAQANFLSEFYRLGGTRFLGYPISQRFTKDGLMVQAFQKAILQWHPETGQSMFVNTLDWLHDAGQDAWLEQQQMTPQLEDTTADAGLSWSAIVARHQGFLSANRALHTAYFANDDPLGHYGLPMSQVVDEGPALVIRCQRAVLQMWKTDQPWAAAGQVTVANSGDIAKQANLFPPSAVVPQTAE